MFVVLLHYIQPLSMIEQFMQQHREFLDRNYRAGHFLVSGPQVPRIGGVILTRNLDRLQLDAVLAEDPFYRERLARYEVIEFNPSKFAEGAEQLFAPAS
jgi:uncharacterized protein YciI